MTTITTSGNRGTVLSVRGSVVDAHFATALPALNNLLRAGERGQVLIEVMFDVSTTLSIVESSSADSGSDPSTAPHPLWLNEPPGPKSSKPASKPSTC